MSSSSPTAAPRSRAAALLIILAILLGLLGVGVWSLSQHAEAPFFLALGALFAWCAGVFLYSGLLAAKPSDTTEGSWIRRRTFQILTVARGWLVLPAAAALSLFLLVQAATSSPHTTTLSPNVLQVALLASLGLAALCQFFQQYLNLLARTHHSKALFQLAALLKGLFWISVLLAAAFLILQYVGFNASPYLAWLLGGLTASLLMEHLCRWVAHLFQPKRHRLRHPLFAGSPLVAAAFRAPSSTEQRSAPSASRFKVADLWFSSHLKRYFLSLAMFSALLIWLSTSVSVVPLDSQGVRVRFGEFVKPALEPGVHLGLPWPFENTVKVPTDRLQEISLGLEEDPGKPILSTESHYVGEKNLLVASGDELLTIAVPIHFRVSDPIAYLTNTTDAKAALTQLAYRELLAQTISRDSFSIMTTERRDVAEALKEGIQSEVDRLELGLDICMVGLKDIHPPVDVAPSYQDVVSAEEDQQSLVHGAEEYRADVLTQAKERSTTVRITADSVHDARIHVTGGEAAAFVSTQEAYAGARKLYQVRHRMLAIEEALKGTKKVVVDHDAAQSMPFYMDMRKVLNPSYAFPTIDEKTSLVPTDDPTNGLNDDFDERRTEHQDPKEMFERIPDVIKQQLLRANSKDGEKLDENNFYDPSLDD